MPLSPLFEREPSLEPTVTTKIRAEHLQAHLDAAKFFEDVTVTQTSNRFLPKGQVEIVVRRDPGKDFGPFWRKVEELKNQS